MITYQEEDYFTARYDLFELYPEHHKEISHTTCWELDMNLDAYSNLCNSGMLKLFTCRDNGRLVGYAMFILSPNLHHKTKVTAFEDIYFLKKEYRQGWVGLKLLKYTEQCLTQLGVHQILFTTKLEHDHSKIFERLGYTDLEKVYYKIVKE